MSTTKLVLKELCMVEPLKALQTHVLQIILVFVLNKEPEW